MSSLNNHIDPLQTALQDKFSDFSFDIDIDVNAVMEASNNVTIANSGLSTHAKYWLGAGGIATGMVLLFFVFNNNEDKQKVSTQNQTTKQTETVISVDNDLKNEPTIENNASIEPVIKPIEVIEKSVPAKKAKIKAKQNNSLDKIATPNNNINQVEHIDIIKPENKEDIKSENTGNFSDFIKMKSIESKDSIQLFKKKVK